MFMHRFIAITLLVSLSLLVVGCASATSDTPAPPPTAGVSSSTPTTVAVIISTPTTAVMSTSIPTVPLPTTAAPVGTESIPMSVDADGYHVIGDPAAPVVMTDYSDYF